MTALTVGFLIEFDRSEQMRTGPFVEVCILAFISYFTPALWLKWRYRDKSEIAWLLIPVLGSILVYLSVVIIPNQISVWYLFGGRIFLHDAVKTFPITAQYFFFAVLLLSGISFLIIGLIQSVEWLFRLFLSKRPASSE